MKTITDVCDCSQHRQYPDLYLPEAESFPVLVYFHGGSLEQGGHCAYVRAVDENGDSVLGKLVLEFIEK